MGLMRFFKSVMGADEKQKSKFVCKFCDKKFPCGKSLGGHLRSHSIARATDQKRHRARQNAKPEPVKISPLSLNNEASSSLSVAYVLRENPKKTQRFGDPGRERLCKECGKGFRSMKALCGHMACHSDKVMMMSKFASDDDAYFCRKLKRKQVVMDSPRRWERSKNKNNLDFFNNIEQEVARCLMMLSRDSSSDNNSVFLEPKSNDSSTQNMKMHNNIDVAEGSDLGIKRPKWVNHKSVDSDSGKQIEIGPFNSIEADSFSVPIPRKANKKIKGHECPICFRVFKSGQALGGHKRSHFLGGSDGRTVDRAPEASGLFDLNLPAREDTARSMAE